MIAVLDEAGQAVEEKLQKRLARRQARSAK